MPKNKRAAKKPKTNLDIPRQRGCLTCARWEAFASKLWECEKLLCPESSCFVLNSATIKPDPSES